MKQNSKKKRVAKILNRAQIKRVKIKSVSAALELCFNKVDL